MYLQYDICYHLTELFAYAFPNDDDHTANMYDYLNQNDLKGFEQYIGHLLPTHRQFIVETYDMITHENSVNIFKSEWNKRKKCPHVIFRIAIFPAFIFAYIEALMADNIIGYMFAFSLFMFSVVMFYKWMNNVNYLSGRDLLVNGDIVRYIPLR